MGWHDLTILDFDGLNDARLQAHYAAQWLARCARGYVEPKPDDSHTSLSWQDESRALVTQQIADGVIIGLSVADLALFTLAPDGQRQTLALDGISDSDAGDWISEEIKAFGFDEEALSDPLPYKLPSHGLAKGAFYDAIAASSALSELSNWFANTNSILTELSSEYQEYTPGPSPVRCWPHHFDIATLIGLEEGDFETSRSIGVGLSPGDEYYEEPYFYVNPWPHIEPVDLPRYYGLGTWHTDGFVGAVATASQIISQDDQVAQVRSFLRQSINFGLERLGA